MIDPHSKESDVKYQVKSNSWFGKIYTKFYRKVMEIGIEVSVPKNGELTSKQANFLINHVLSLIQMYNYFIKYESREKRKNCNCA